MRLIDVRLIADKPYVIHNWRLEVRHSDLTASSYLLTTPYGLVFDVKPREESLKVSLRSPCCNHILRRVLIIHRDRMVNPFSWSKTRVMCSNCNEHIVTRDEVQCDDEYWRMGEPLPQNLQSMLDGLFDPLTAAWHGATLHMVLTELQREDHRWTTHRWRPFANRAKRVRAFMQAELEENL